jgi:hypothetical protein
MFRSALILALTSFACAQSQNASPPAQFATAAPKVLLLVYQQFLPGKAGTRQNLQTQVARTFDRIGAPLAWIELESLTGASQALFVDPANSFGEIEKAGGVLAQIYASRADLGQSQQQIDDLIASSRTVTASLRDDLSFNSAELNLGRARYLRIRVVQVRPERERDFVNGFVANRPQASTPGKAWAAYQVNAGSPDLTFIILEPMRSLHEVDQELSNAAPELPALAATTSSETNLYAIHPEMSHVAKDFSTADPNFWPPPPAP